MSDCLCPESPGFPVGNEEVKALLAIVSNISFIGLLAAVVVGGVINAMKGG